MFIRGLLPALILLLLSGAATAAPVKGIRAAVEHPIAPRGGVLMLPLTAEQHGDRWPSEIELTLADGRTVVGRVAWIEPLPESPVRHWTDDPRGLRIRAVRPGDDSSAIDRNSTLGPYLLARMPADVDGRIQMFRQSITPSWRDPVNTADHTDRMELALAQSPDRPDPNSPFEYWRWVLLADRLDMRAPAPAGDEIQQMVAEHYAALWRIALARLAQHSPRIAEQCRDLLTQTCIDRRQPFAVWVSDPAQVGSLLGRLLRESPSGGGPELISDAVAWIDDQQSLMLWTESEAGDQVRLLAATAMPDPVVARFQWLESKEPAVAVQVEPGVLSQVIIDRMKPAPPPIGMPEVPELPRQTLDVQVDRWREQIVFGPRVVEAHPPGVYFRPLAPPLTLAEMQMSRQRSMPPDRATFVHLRRLSGRWEVFFECRRPESVMTSGWGKWKVEIDGSSLDSLRGTEAVTLLLGPDTADQGPEIWLTIPENDWARVVRGENDGTLQVHKRQLKDRWFCRVVLPDSWFSADLPGPALIGFVRSHGDTMQLETGPNACLPWRPTPSRAAIDLTQWDDLPQSDPR